MTDQRRPRLAPGVRRRHDAVRDHWVLLGPEQIIELEGPASEILALCDGARTIERIAVELAENFDAEVATIAADVAELIDELVVLKLVEA